MLRACATHAWTVRNLSIALAREGRYVEDAKGAKRIVRKNNDQANTSVHKLGFVMSASSVEKCFVAAGLASRIALLTACTLVSASGQM